MTERYSQTVEMTVSSKTKAMQWIGIASILFALGFLMLTIFLKWYFVFGFLAIFAIGAVYLHIYNASAKEYIYEFSPDRLKIAKKDLMGRTRLLLTLMLDDATGCGIMEGLTEDGDVVACASSHEAGVYQLIYKEQDKLKRLLFAPDTYMTALLKETLGEKFKDNAQYEQNYLS